MKLILTRHGRTVDNEAGICQGHNPGKLSELGEKQADLTGLRLKEEKIQAIYSSDLHRAVQTTERIAVHHSNIKPTYVEVLRERFLGPFQGKKWNKSEISSEEAEEKGLIETREQAYQRAKNFLDYLLENHQDETVLCIGHGGINRALVRAIYNLQPEQTKEVEHMKNTALSIFTINPDRTYQEEFHNCVKHLEKLV